MNKIELRFNATLENESVVRNTIGLFAATINWTMEFNSWSDCNGL